jgi:hypothetical protein
MLSHFFQLAPGYVILKSGTSVAGLAAILETVYRSVSHKPGSWDSHTYFSDAVSAGFMKRGLTVDLSPLRLTV